MRSELIEERERSKALESQLGNLKIALADFKSAARTARDNEIEARNSWRRWIMTLLDLQESIILKQNKGEQAQSDGDYIISGEILYGETPHMQNRISNMIHALQNPEFVLSVEI